MHVHIQMPDQDGGVGRCATTATPTAAELLGSALWESVMLLDASDDDDVRGGQQEEETSSPGTTTPTSGKKSLEPENYRRIIEFNVTRTTPAPWHIVFPDFPVEAGEPLRAVVFLNAVTDPLVVPGIVGSMRYPGLAASAKRSGFLFVRTRVRGIGSVLLDLRPVLSAVLAAVRAVLASADALLSDLLAVHWHLLLHVWAVIERCVMQPHNGLHTAAEVHELREEFGFCFFFVPLLMGLLGCDARTLTKTARRELVFVRLERMADHEGVLLTNDLRAAVLKGLNRLNQPPLPRCADIPLLL